MKSFEQYNSQNWLELFIKFIMQFNKAFAKRKFLLTTELINSVINGKFISLLLFWFEYIYDIIFFLSSKLFEIKIIFESNFMLFNR